MLLTGLKRLGCSFVPGVLATPLAADAIELHGTIGEGHTVKGGGTVERGLAGGGSKGL